MLVVAAARGDHCLIHRLLQDAHTELAAHALLVAAHRGHLEVVRTIVQHDVNVLNEWKGFPPLHAACLNGHVEVVEYLLQCEAVNACRSFWLPVLHIACYSGNADIVQILLNYTEAARRVTTRTSYPRYLRTRKVWLPYLPGAGALAYACLGSHFDIVQLLLEEGASVNVKGNDFSPLSAACMAGNLDITALLLEKGAETSGLRYSPLLAASRLGHVEIVELLLDWIPDLSNSAAKSLMYACEKGHDEVVSLLVRHGAHQQADQLERTPLHIACVHGWTETARILLENGATQRKDHCGRYPLCNAIKSENVDLVKLLLDWSHDASSVSFQSSCKTAFRTDNKEIISVLKDYAQMNDLDFPDVNWTHMSSQVTLSKIY